MLLTNDYLIKISSVLEYDYYLEPIPPILLYSLASWESSAQRIWREIGTLPDSFRIWSKNGTPKERQDAKIESGNHILHCIQISGMRRSQLTYHLNTAHTETCKGLFFLPSPAGTTAATFLNLR